MSKRINIEPNERLDVVDVLRGFNEFTEDELKLHNKNVVSGNKAYVLSGFQVRVDSAANRLVTVFNGSAVNANGQLMVEETNPATSRQVQLPSANGTYYLEAEFITSESDVDSRAFWDPTANAGAGGEFSQNIPTRLTPDWRIVTPVSTSGFSTNPNRIRIASLVVAAGSITTSATEMPFSTVMSKTSTTVTVAEARTFPSSGTATFVHKDGSASTVLAYTSVNYFTNTLSFVSTVGVVNGDICRITSAATNLVADVNTTKEDKLWIPSTSRGALLRSTPHQSSITAGPSNRNVLTLKDFIDANAATIAAAKIPNYTIGDGITTFGDFNGTNEKPFLAAVAALAGNGGVIFVRDGAYAFNASVVVDYGIRFIAESEGNVVITAATNLANGLFYMQSGGAPNYVHFEHMKFGTSVTTTPALVFEGSTYSSVSKCYFDNYPTTAIVIKDASWVSVRDSYIGFKSIGISIEGTGQSDAFIDNNHFVTTAAAATAAVNRASGVAGGFVVVCNNQLSGSLSITNGINLATTTGKELAVFNNHCNYSTAPSTAVINIQNQGGIVQNNTIQGATSVGIKINANNLVCSENSILFASGSAAIGIQVTGGTDISLLSNSIRGNSVGTGITTSSATRISILGNHLNTLTTGISGYSTGSALENNFFTSITGTCITGSVASSVKFLHNDFSAVGTSGATGVIVATSSFDGCQFIGNNFSGYGPTASVGAAGTACILAGSFIDRTVITNNTFRLTGTQWGFESDIYVDGPCTRSKICDNYMETDVSGGSTVSKMFIVVEEGASGSTIEDNRIIGNTDLSMVVLNNSAVGTNESVEFSFSSNKLNNANATFLGSATAHCFEVKGAAAPLTFSTGSSICWNTFSTVNILTGSVATKTAGKAIKLAFGYSASDAVQIRGNYAGSFTAPYSGSFTESAGTAIDMNEFY